MYQRAKVRFYSVLNWISPSLGRLVERRKVVVKYTITGAATALLNLGLVYVFTDIVGVWYVASSLIGYSVSLVINFFLQKIWTFRDPAFRSLYWQFAAFGVLATFNAFLNPILLYSIVEYLHVWYLLGQFIVIILLAATNFLVNRHITFKQH